MTSGKDDIRPAADKSEARSELSAGTVRNLWIAGIGVLVALVVLDVTMVEHHPVFGFEATPGFGVWFAILASGAAVLVAKIVGFILTRPDTYYDH